MKKVVVLGAGESGTGAALLAKAKNFEVFVSDGGKILEKYKKILEENEIPFEEGTHTPEIIFSANEIIKSPGIPDNTPIVLAALEKQIPVISEIEFGFRHTKAKIIAITGSNGKTTTTLLTYHILKNAGLNVGLAGNVGESFAQKVIENHHEYYVLEVSSFQLDGCFLFKPYISAILNITPDHLDRYESFEAYADAKFRIIRSQNENDYFIYNADSEIIEKKILKLKPAVQQLAITLAAKDDLKAISKVSYYQNGKIITRLPYNRPSQLTFQESDIALQGKHNIFNAMVAILVAQILGVDNEKIKEGLATFQGVPHRLEQVREVRGVKFINDSKATNVDSVFYALDSFEEEKKIIWIAGGVDKGNNYEQIKDLVAGRVKHLIALGKDNSKLCNFFENAVDITKTDNIEEAVKKAYKLAKKGDIVLLSPACASFDLFKNYEDRGEQFRKAVESLK
ncbi:UDP-N-acetylmuramoyl-L-alanine--D-glutamate ligase [Raineya orbicola]|jgi:UDP-N-acetylmuramoylalanine--D-glutamate ligase|uniref:UDP-N-acetylmuramoylalanine--D-glutamate ligase n=1 Tax=Raineya orbicola TaxID=2016530 RepID=A0A2N3IHD3_9BACT|nr:UDP-N-acetylmuramoyl-L-alanine--D-glutamate ligase [Raineya orbicola]PKQ69717.1 murD: UDP-N-acetylmuramoylalanine--D-glutamate ligase [Raineya orbicola]